MLSYSKYIIDAHAHIFPDKIAQKATDNIGSFYDLYMNFDGTADMLIKQGNECGVSKYVVRSSRDKAPSGLSEIRYKR